MFWRIIFTLGALTFLGSGCDVLSTEGCDQVDFGGSRRSSTYNCTYGEYEGDMPATAAGGLMVGGSVLGLGLAWLPLLRRRSL